MTNITKFKYSIGSDVLGMYWYGNLYFGWFDLLRMCWFILPTDICQAMLVMLHDKVRRCVYWKRIYISVYLKPTLSLVLCVCFVDHCLSVCPFVLFLLVIVLSVLLRFTHSDYPFGIFKLFLFVTVKFPSMGVPFYLNDLFYLIPAMNIAEI